MVRFKIKFRIKFRVRFRVWFRVVFRVRFKIRVRAKVRFRVGAILLKITLGGYCSDAASNIIGAKMWVMLARKTPRFKNATEFSCKAALKYTISSFNNNNCKLY